MTTFPKYERYKDSGVEWLGEVPEHWEVRSLRGLLKERSETNEGTKTEFILSVMKDRGVIPYTEKGNVGNKMSEDITNYKIVQPGDLVINKMNAIIGSLGISMYHGALSKVYFVMQPRYDYVLNRFYGYLFQIRDFQKSLSKISYGIMELRESINFNEFKNLPLPLPPKPEQDRIVAFLDQKTAEIDALIAKKQRQIELLDEQKAILINRAVTRGLNPNTKLKPSGIEWIGDIPAHWEVVPLKRNANVQTGLTLGKDYPPSRSVEVPYLRVANVQNGHLALGSVTTLRVPKSLVSRYALQEGDVLVAEGGDLDKLGRGCVWRSEIETCMHQNHVFAVRPNPTRILPEFLSLALSCKYGQRYFMLTGKQTTNLASTNSTALMSFPVALPSVEEQADVLKSLDKIKTRFKDLTSLIESETQSLKTLRSTLIAHAVIGRIKL